MRLKYASKLESYMSGDNILYAKRCREHLLHSTTPVAHVALIPRCGARVCTRDCLNATAKAAKSSYLRPRQ